MKHVGSRIAITGASGFLGSAVRERLIKEQIPLQLLVHNNREFTYNKQCQIFQCDVTKPETLKGVLDDVNVLVHLSSYIGHDVKLAKLVNGEGTRNIVAEAKRVGVKQIIYVSTTAMYTEGKHSGITEEQSIVAPQSAVSHSRVIAEASLRHFQKSVILRPMFVYGMGDKWFVPTIVSVLKAGLLPPEKGRALLSLISVDNLAEIIIRVLQLNHVLSGTFHVSELPITLCEIIESIEALLGFDKRVSTFDSQHGWENAVRQKLSLSGHQVQLLSHDHYYDCSLLNQEINWQTTSSFKQLITQYKPWYIKYLSSLNVLA